MILYCLTFTDKDMSYEGVSKDYVLGMFESVDIAENVAGYYLENVPGFKDYDCDYSIDEKEVMGEQADTDSKEVWYTWGYNINEQNDKADVVKGQLYHTGEQAEKGIEDLKAEYSRDKWVADKYIIGQIGWAEGFKRE